MAFTSAVKSPNNQTVYGQTDSGQLVGFANPTEYAQAFGMTTPDFSKVVTLPNFNPSGAINYSDFLKGSSPSVSTPLLPVGTRASSVNPQTTEYYNTQTGQGFANPLALANFVNTLAPTAQANEKNVFGIVDPIIKTPQAVSGPIPADGLKEDNYAKLSKILGATVTPDMVSSDVAGLLALSGASSDDQKSYDKYVADITKKMSELGGESADITAEMEKQGVGAAFQQVKELNLKSAQLKGELEKIDVDTVAGAARLEDKPITQGAISTQQSSFEKQQNLLRLSKAAELSATLAMAQAYQGNAQLGLDLAKQAVDLKYRPIENEINVLKTQLGFAKEKLTGADARRAKIIEALITTRENEISTKKNVEKEINTLAIDAAKNGAPLSVITAMRGSLDAVAAASVGAGYLKGSAESTSGDGTGIPEGGAKFTPEDKQALLGAGFTPAEIVKIQADINQFGIDAVKQGMSDEQKRAVDKVLTGREPEKKYLTKDFIKTLFEDIDQSAFDAGFKKKGGGIFGTGIGARESADVDAFLEDQIKKVEEYRKQGFTDKEIEALIKK